MPQTFLLWRSCRAIYNGLFHITSVFIGRETIFHSLTSCFWDCQPFHSDEHEHNAKLGISCVELEMMHGDCMWRIMCPSNLLPGLSRYYSQISDCHSLRLMLVIWMDLTFYCRTSPAQYNKRHTWARHKPYWLVCTGIACMIYYPNSEAFLYSFIFSFLFPSWTHHQVLHDDSSLAAVQIKDMT